MLDLGPCQVGAVPQSKINIRGCSQKLWFTLILQGNTLLAGHYGMNKNVMCLLRQTEMSIIILLSPHIV